MTTLSNGAKWAMGGGTSGRKQAHDGCTYPHKTIVVQVMLRCKLCVAEWSLPLIHLTADTPLRRAVVDIKFGKSKITLYICTTIKPKQNELNSRTARYYRATK